MNRQRANLMGQDMAGQDLRGHDFRQADLRHCRLVGADLRGADLRGADLSMADLTDALLDDAKVLGCIMHKTIGARRNGGPVMSVVGLHYPVLIDGRFATFGCDSPETTIEHTGRGALDRAELLRMDKRQAVAFHDLGCELLRWYRTLK